MTQVRPGETLRQLAESATEGQMFVTQDVPDGIWWVSRIEPEPEDVAVFLGDQEADARLFAQARAVHLWATDAAEELRYIQEWAHDSERHYDDSREVAKACADLLARLRAVEDSAT